MAKKSANEILLELKAENKELKAKLKDSEKIIGKLEKKVKSSGGSMNNVFKKVKQYALAYLGVEAVTQLVNLAGEIESVEGSFHNLANTAEMSSDGLLEAMKTASKGTVSNMDIMRSSNLAFQLMGEEVAGHLPKMMEIAMASARSQGKRTADMFNDIVVASGRRSIQILDNLGISSATAAKYQEEFATQLGKTRNQLNESEKSQAFFYATMKAGGELVNKIGNETLTLGEKLQVAKARMDDMAYTAGKILTPAIDNLVNIFLEWTDTSKEGREEFSLWETVIKGVGYVLNHLAAGIEGAKLIIESLIQRVKDIVDAFKLLQDTGDFTLFRKKLMDDYTRSLKQNEEASWALYKKYLALDKEIESGGRESKRSNIIRGLKSEEDKVEDLRKAYEQEMNNRITYYEYINKFHEASLIREQLQYEKINALNTSLYKDKTELMQAYEDKKILAAQESDNKIMQSNIAVSRARLKLDSVQIQSTKEVFGQASTLMQSRNKLLFSLGKALAYANAIMNAAESITKIWAVYGWNPVLAGVFTGISAAATGVQIAKIQQTKLPSYQKGRTPEYTSMTGFTPSDHFPALVGSKEAVINERSTLANLDLIKSMNDNPGEKVTPQQPVIVNQNITGNVLSKDFVLSSVLPELKIQARYAGKNLFSQKER
jgi:hypothetical protein